MGQDSEAAVERDPSPAARSLPVTHVKDIAPASGAESWLVDSFLSKQSLTVLAASPKTGKTWVALSVAVAVATGRPALGIFHVPEPGPVLIFPAEDRPESVRSRIDLLLRNENLTAEAAPVHIITATSLKLDKPEDRAALEETVRQTKPSLIVLDPLVRLHSGPEGYSGHIAELVGYLRTLQRKFGVSVLVTHHAAKSVGRVVLSPGELMRGSGDIHAAYDHGVALQRRRDGGVLLTLEHRGAESPGPVSFRLCSTEGRGIHFEILEDEDVEEEPEPVASRKPRVRRTAPKVPLRAQVLKLLGGGSPLSQRAMRDALKVRNQDLTNVLRELEQEGAVKNCGRMGGWELLGSSGNE